MFDVSYAVNLLIWLLNIYLVTGMWRFFFWLNNNIDKLSCVWFQKRMPFILKFKHYKHFTTNTSSIRGRKIELQYLMHICIDVLVDIIMEMIFKWNRSFNRKLREGHFVSISFATLVLLVFIIWLSVRYRKRRLFFFFLNIYKKEKIIWMVL